MNPCIPKELKEKIMAPLGFCLWIGLEILPEISAFISDSNSVPLWEGARIEEKKALLHSKGVIGTKEIHNIFYLKWQ